MAAEKDVIRAVLTEHWFHDGGDTCECGYWADLDVAKRHHIEDVLRADLSARLTAAEAVAAVAEAISEQQAVSRVPYPRRVGFRGRLSLARSALDVVCDDLGVPNSIDQLVLLPEQQADR